MRRQLGMVLMAVMLTLTACGDVTPDVKESETQISEEQESAAQAEKNYEDAYVATLSADGNHVFSIPEGKENPFVVDHNIVYYEAGHDFTYGEGTEADEHTAEEAAEHTVLHITQPGTYILSGTLERGQIAVDLGEGADEDPEAVVTLVLDGLDVTCTVAPAVIFYQVYECADADNPSQVVDTSSAGANVVLADDSMNQIQGSYVARIYKSVELNEEGTEVLDSKKLHKYDGAFYSKMSMNIDGGVKGNGVLSIEAENEGLDSEMHLTINGGEIRIHSGNDGINTNEDEVSVTTINGGRLHIVVNGATGEGDGIDSNGWLVINGGTVVAEACSFSGDAGIDSDMGIHVNGGVLVASGNMLDRISESDANYAVFQFAERIQGGTDVVLKNENGEAIVECAPSNDFSYLIVSSEDLVAGEYTLWADDVQMAHGGIGGFGDGRGPMGQEQPPADAKLPEGVEPPADREKPEGGEFPESMTPPEDGEFPEGMTPPEGGEFPEGMTPPEGAEFPQAGERPGNGRGGRYDNTSFSGEQSEVFSIREGGNPFSGIGKINVEIL